MDKKFILAILLMLPAAFAYDMSFITDKYTYGVNESIFAVGMVKINTTAISNVSVVFTVKDVSDTTVSTTTFVTNSTGNFNSTFSLTTAGNYTLIANVSGDFVKHSIKVKPYAKIYMSLNRPSFTSGSAGTLTASVLDANSLGVASQPITSSIRVSNGTVVSTLSTCTTDSQGQCLISFTAPANDGSYMLEVNNFEAVVPLVVGGFDAFMKVSPSIVGKGQNATVRVIVKNSNGNGITASTRQLVVTAPNGTQTTISSIPAANDSSGKPMTGVYETTLVYNSEGTYEVKATIQPQGSNLTREMSGKFTVSSYLIDVVPWPGSTTLFTPGETISLGIRLRNASSNEFMRTTQCGSGSCVTSLGAASVLDSSGVPTGYSPSVSEQTSVSLYRMDIALPAGAKSGSYKVRISLNDSFGTGNGEGYFSVQLAKGKMRAIDKFPNGVSKESFLPGKQIVLELSVNNASGAVNITSINSYAIRDMSGSDKTSIFGSGTTYSGGNNKSYINLTAPKQGGRYQVRAKVVTALGNVDIESMFFIDVLEIEIRPQAIGGGPGGGGMPFGGPGYMFAFRPNDTVQLAVTVTTAQEKRGSEGFMRGDMAKGGSAGGGHSVGVGGMFGIGGGSTVQGAQIVVDRIINLNTDEDITTSTTITNCITASNGACTLSLKSNVNGQNWTGGFHIVFVNVTTSDNQSDDSEGFFEVRRYFVNVQTRSATVKDATTSGFQSFSDWFIGPDDNVNVSITIIEPGTWQTVTAGGNATVLGFYYGGNMGEFIFPPKQQSGTTAKVTLTGGINSTVINAPSGGWKSGFYIVKVLANVSGTLDTGESFMMVKIYEGFGQPINPTTRQMDLTVGTNENVSVSINVFDVRNNRPAANLTVTLNKIMAFTSFPPTEISYDKSLITAGTTDANGQVIMTLPAPSGGWSTGDHLASFDVTNGTVTDSIPGFFQVRNFFVEVSPAKWRFATNETVAFNVTISSDPSWMRQMFGGGCPAGDPMCASGGGPPPSGSSGGGGGGDMFGGGGPINQIDITAAYGDGYDIDNDGIKDINITLIPQPPDMGARPDNLTVARGSNASVSAEFWCDIYNPTECAGGAVANVTNGFDGFSCDSVTSYSNVSTRTHNASGPSYFCVNTSTGVVYKVQARFGDATTRQIGAVRHIPGSVGGIASIDLSGTQGFSYYNATLKSVKVIKFDFETGETLLRQVTDYNVTSSTGSTKGNGNIVIPGVGSFRLVPATTWASGFYRVIAEFNTSAAMTETGESGFSIETFFANCYRSAWGAVSSETNVTVRCDVMDPGTGGNYTSYVDMTVESVRNMFTFQNVASGAGTWTATTNNTNRTKANGVIQLSQSLSNGQYEATIKLNASSSDVKRQSIWFEVKDFEPSFWSERWSYAASDAVTLRAEARVNNAPVEVNLSNNEIVVYRYDKSSGSKSTVSNVTMNITFNHTSYYQPYSTTINISKSNGWDEGDYEVVANITKAGAFGAPIGSSVEVRTWFSVRLFDVWGWSEPYSSHPKSNVSLRVHVGSAGSWWQNYNGMVNATVTAITNTQTGATLTSGTDYNSTSSLSNPSTAGDLNINITSSASGFTIGSYKATVQVTDVTSTKAVITDTWFEIRAFNFGVYTERYDYAAAYDVVFRFKVESPSGDRVNITGARIREMSRCTSTSCTSVNVATLNTAFNDTMLSLTILSTSNLITAWYSANIEVNDSSNATASGWTGFQIKSFGITGFAQNPASDRYYYYINENITLNVTGTIGTNITNVTLTYWDYPSGGGTGVEKKLVRVLGNVLAASNELVNITPPGFNNTWPTGEWGWMWYSIEVGARKDSDTSMFWTGAGVNFPYIWNITGPTDITPTDNLTSNITVYIDFNNAQRLANAVVNVTGVKSTSAWVDVNSSVNAWNHTGNVTNANGFATVTLRPDINLFNWTTGQMIVDYTARYGNATVKGQRWINVAQKTLNVLGRSLKNSTGAPGGTNAQTLTAAPSCTTETAGLNECWYNLTVSIHNPNSDAASGDMNVVTSWLNLTATVNNRNSTGASHSTNATQPGVSIPAGASATFNFTYNVTGITNITHQTQFTPQAGGFAPLKTTYTYSSA